LLVMAVPSRTIWGGSRDEAKATGSLTVKIKPQKAKQAGARWQADGGVWQRSGRTVTDLSAGPHTVSFKSISGWTAPADESVDVQADVTTTAEGTYAWSQGGTQTLMLPGNVPLKMVWIPAGSFMMGRYSGEQDSWWDEGPQHQVTFAQGFWMGKCEVTQRQWVAVMGSNPSQFTGDLRHPVEQVSWKDVHSFITAVNGLGQGRFRLPSEAEWEYACRAGTTTRFYWGDDPSYTQIGNYAWWESNSSSTTHPVGQKLANAWGLYDMSGNVWEWCVDWYHGDYFGAPTDGSAWVSPRDNVRVFRGGGWNLGLTIYRCRSACRAYIYPSSAGGALGFRLAR